MTGQTFLWLTSPDSIRGTHERLCHESLQAVFGESTIQLQLRKDVLLLSPEPGLVGVHRLVRPDEVWSRRKQIGNSHSTDSECRLSMAAFAGMGPEGFFARKTLANRMHHVGFRTTWFREISRYSTPHGQS